MAEVVVASEAEEHGAIALCAVVFVGMPTVAHGGLDVAAMPNFDIAGTAAARLTHRENLA